MAKEKSITKKDIAELLAAQTKTIIKAVDRKVVKKIDDLALMIGNGFNETTNNFGIVNERFDVMDKRMEAVEIKLGSVDNRLEKVERKMNLIEKSLLIPLSEE